MAAPQFAASQTTIPLMFASQFAVVPTIQTASYAVPAQAAPAQAMSQSQATCQASASRVDELEQRLESLRSRVNVLQTSIDNQTTLLEKIVERLDSGAAGK